MKILETTFTDLKKQANAVINSSVLNKLKGNDITVINYVLYEADKKDEKTGESYIQKLLTFETKEGEFFGTVSENVIEGWQFINLTMGGVSPQNPITVHISTEKSKNDRDFLQISVV